jgi:hypothetical protein
MRTRTDNAPLGNDPATDSALRNRDRLQNEHQFYDSTTVKVEQTTRGVRFHAKIPPQQQPQTPVAPLSFGEWSPDATYNFNNIVKISLGPAQGTYIYVNSTPSKGNLPWVGAPFWSQLIGGLTSMWQ